MRRFPTKALRRAAFTLIELIVVIAIMSMMIGAAGFILGASSEASAEAASIARRLGGTMEDAQRFRQLHSSYAWIDYDFANQEIRFYVERPLEGGEIAADIERDPQEFMMEVAIYKVGDPEEPDTSLIWLSSVETFDGDVHNDGLFTVTFNPDGSAIGHIVHIMYRGEKNENGVEELRDISVELNPVTGMASVYEFYKELEKGRVP